MIKAEFFRKEVIVMRRVHLILLALIIAALLCGCGEKAPSEAAPAAPAESTASAETSAPAETAAPAKSAIPAEPAPEGLRTEYRQEDVKNNGGYFLGLGDCVYFREYPLSAFAEPALWGEFLQSPAPDTVVPIRIYDAKARTLVAEIPDDGYGRIWFADGLLWLQRSDGQHNHVYTLTPDGKERREVVYGHVAGVSEDGALICIQGSVDSKLSIWKDGNPVSAVKPTEEEYFTFCGFAGDSVLYLSQALGSSRAEIRQLTADGKTYTLGLTHEMPELEGLYAPEFQQIIVDGDKVWMVFSWYQGTGHYYYDSRAVELTLGVENSVKSFHLPSKDPDARMVPPVLLLTESGKVEVVPEKEQTVRLSEDVSGSLDYIDSPFSAVRLIENFIPTEPYENGGKVIQTAEIVGDSAYLVLADCTRDAAGDIGWRYAYSLNELSYLRVPLKENSAAENVIAYG